ncbi:N-methyl-L-tryptophan oxidase [Variovorax sp. HJSM1_2]|uniref:N-methyl-L-tryptophan oxidase n=1 Tax=Variovorax sp. HJSM1_2 TaxID=3366263 RepID=UPI003BD0D28C
MTQQKIPHFDAIVIGLGAMGAATLYQLAKRGARVLGLDQFSPPHTLGSSHGQTRITRLAVGEGDAYVPLVQRAHEIWAELEAATGQSIYTRTHGLVLGPRDAPAVRADKSGDFVRNTIDIAQRNNIVHEVLDTADLRRRYPQFKLRGDEFAYWERDAGFVRPEVAIGAQLQQAQVLGATAHLQETVTDLVQDGDSVLVSTSRGTYRAEQVVLTAGPWLQQLLRDSIDKPALAQSFNVYRQVMYWFDVGAATPSFAPENFPVFIWTLGDEAGSSFYGFPAAGPGTPALKVATAQYQTSTTPATIDRVVSPDEIDAALARLVSPHFNVSQARCTEAHACLYTVTPDHGFVIDRLAGWQGVHLASPCSGHGFKHSAAIGEVLARRVLGLPDAIDLSAFAEHRLA